MRLSAFKFFNPINFTIKNKNSYMAVLGRFLLFIRKDFFKAVRNNLSNFFLTALTQS